MLNEVQSLANIALKVEKVHKCEWSLVLVRFDSSPVVFRWIEDENKPKYEALFDLSFHLGCNKLPSVDSGDVTVMFLQHRDKWPQQASRLH